MTKKDQLTITYDDEIFFVAEKNAQTPYFIVNVKNGMIQQGVHSKDGGLGTYHGLSMSPTGILAYTRAVYARVRQTTP